MDTVTVWLVRTDQPAAVTARLSRLLDPEELRRAATMPDPIRRAQFTVAHGALREIVAAHLGRPAATLRWTRGLHGKPELAVAAAAADPGAVSQPGPIST